MRSPESIYSAPAAADYSATNYRFATLNGSGQIATVGTAGGDALGVLSNSPASGKDARIEWDGVHRIDVGTGGLALGDVVGSDNAGKGVHDVTSGHVTFGICSKAGAAGEVAEFVWSKGKN